MMLQNSNYLSKEFMQIFRLIIETYNIWIGTYLLIYIIT